MRTLFVFAVIGKRLAEKSCKCYSKVKVKRYSFVSTTYDSAGGSSFYSGPDVSHRNKMEAHCGLEL